MKIILFLCVFISSLYFNETAFMKNKYVVDVQSVEYCPEVSKNNIKNLKFSRYNRTHKTLNYDFEYKQPLDEKVGGNIVAAKWGDGGWITIPFIGFQKNICQFMLKHFKVGWVSFHSHVEGIPHPDKCPIPAGNYSLKNYVIETTSLNLPFFGGRLRFTTTFQNEKTSEIRGPFSMDLDTVSVCPDNDDLEVPIRLFRVDRLNRTHRILNSDFTIAHPLDADTEASAKTEKWGDGGWKVMPLYPPIRNPCKSLQDYCYLVKACKEEVAKVAAALGWKDFEKCPIPAGNYSMHNYPFTLTQFKQKSASFWRGRFRVTYILKRLSTNKKILCIMYTVNFVETAE